MLEREIREGVEVDCGITYGHRFSIRLRDGRFEAYARDLIMRKDIRGKVFDDVDEAINYGGKWRANFQRTRNIEPI